MDERKRNINRLKAGASYFGCGGYLSKLDTLHRLDIYNKLGFERLSRKNRDINRIFEQSQQNWQQTFYTMLMRTMGGVDNSEAFTELARRVPYAVLLREREVAANVEALLIGASGLLTLYPHDEYILNLKRNFSYLSTKYSITAMEASAWRLKRIYPNNHPILRLSQVASFITYTREMMDHMLACTSGDDVYNLFSCQTLPYWQTHYIPASTSP
ncbi:MAG: DUF2851 family protein, partial [Alistipes sp.]|nr:DUF2851 family protein [Alistipes sp.]